MKYNWSILFGILLSLLSFVRKKHRFEVIREICNNKRTTLQRAYVPNILPHIKSLVMCPSSIRVWHEMFQISGLNFVLSRYTWQLRPIYRKMLLSTNHLLSKLIVIYETFSMFIISSLSHRNMLFVLKNIILYNIALNFYILCKFF